MTGPTVAIDLRAIVENTRKIVAMCAVQGAEVWGVTKAACGSPAVARAMLRGGAAGLADSRIDNVRRLRHGGIDAPIMMLRIPSPSEAGAVAQLCDVSLNSELRALEALDAEAARSGKRHDVILMVEMGDRREGAAEDELPALCEAVLASEALNLAGIGANWMCASGVLPTPEKLQRLARIAEDVEARFDTRLRWVSGGNSANLPLMRRSPLPPRINQLRIGAAILRGEDVTTGGTLPGLRADAFTLEAELIEIKVKPSLPDGQTGPDAFGMVRSFVDRGERVRGIVNLGRLDIRPEGLTPRDRDVVIETASSDHLIVDLTEARRYAVGDRMAFDMDYGALAQALLSPYVEKRLTGREDVAPQPRRVRISADPAMLRRPETRRFIEAVRALGLDVAEGGDPAPGDLPLHIAADRAAEPRVGEAELGVLAVDAAPGDVSHLPAETSALLGLRQATPEQARAIRERGILALTMEDVSWLGIREAVRRALRHVTSATDGFALILHASAGHGMTEDPHEAGLSYRELHTVMERVAANRGLRAITLSGFPPDAPGDALTAAYDYLLSALGKRILSAPPAD